MSPIAILLIIGATAGVIYLLVRREPAGPTEPRSVSLAAVAQVEHGEPALLVGEIEPDHGLTAVQAPFGGGEVLYHSTRLERVEDAPPEQLDKARAAAGPSAAAPSPAAPSPMGGPGLGGLLGGLLGGPGAGAAGPPARPGAPPPPPPGSKKGLVLEKHEGPERWLLADESGVALVAPFVSEKPPALRLQATSERELRRVSLAEVETWIKAAGKDPAAIPGLAAPEGDADASDVDEGQARRLSDAFVIKQQLLRVGERVLVAGRGQQIAELGEPDEADALREAQRRQQAVRALSGQQPEPQVLLSGDRQRELFISNDDQQIAAVARRALSDEPSS
jgi:hypothetical protein